MAQPVRFLTNDEIALFDAMIDTAQKAFSTAYQEISSHVEAPKTTDVGGPGCGCRVVASNGCAKASGREGWNHNSMRGV